MTDTPTPPIDERIRKRIAELEQYAERLRIEYERVQGALGELRNLLDESEESE